MRCDPIRSNRMWCDVMLQMTQSKNFNFIFGYIMNDTGGYNPLISMVAISFQSFSKREYFEP